MIRKRIQLALIHVAVAMTLVPINSTLNRVMIKELAISATLVAVLASLPYLFSPIQVVIGSFSDRHPVLGWRRSPYILAGLALCVLGVALAPAAVTLIPENRGLGLLLSLLVFGAWGMGFNVASVAYLSLASELSGERGRSRTVSIMWFMMIVAIILTAATLSHMLTDFNLDLLRRAFLSVGAAALALGLVGLIGLEPRVSAPAPRPTERGSWVKLSRLVLENPVGRRFFVYMIVLLAAILGQDILLEPFAAEAFHLPVAATTRITSIWGGCVLAALLAASFLERRIDKKHVARLGAWGALAGFVVIVLSGLLAQTGVFYGGVVLLGLGTGLSTVSNLSLMMDMTTAQTGLFIGAWGMADALARLLGALLSGGLRDLVTAVSGNFLAGYHVVFLVEAGLLFYSLYLLGRIDVAAFRRQASPPDLMERAAWMNDAQ